MKLLSDKNIPRYFSNQPKIESLELHGFCDASESAYAAVSYIRAIDSTGHPLISLVAKVVPIKRLTIPRLELRGALVLARMLHHLRSLLNIPLGKVHAWTDSTIVLCWMREKPRQLKTFVGNRIAEIVELIPLAPLEPC